MTPGMTGIGRTVLSGDDISTFDVKVLGVLPDAIFLGIDVIVMEMTGPADVVDLTGGAIAGMSGSPVYIGGKLAGALAWAIAENRHIFGVTAAEDMMSLFDVAAGSSKPMPTEIALTREARLAVARATGSSLESTASTMEALPIPLGVSGTGASSLAEIEGTFAEHGIPVTAFRAGSAVAPTDVTLDPTPLVPGGGFGMGLSYGDVSWYGFGTTTAVCGDYAIGWGHPFWGTGDVSMGLNDVNVIAIDNGTFWGTKIGTLTEAHGTMTEDRFPGVVGTFGVLPHLIPIDSTFSSPDTGLARDGHTDVAWDQGWFVAEAAWAHASSNVGYVMQAQAPGTLGLSWTIRGTLADGTPFTISNRTMRYSEWSAGEGIWRMSNALYTLVYSGFDPVTFTGVDMAGTVTEQNLTAKIVKVRVASSLQPKLRARDLLKARPGDQVTVEVTLDPVDGANVVATGTFEVPMNVKGVHEVLIRGGRERWRYGSADSIEELIDQLSGGEHANDLIVQGLGGSSTWEQGVVVSGKHRFWVEVVR